MKIKTQAAAAVVIGLFALGSKPNQTLGIARIF
jgi:hypothetical protein